MKQAKAMTVHKGKAIILMADDDEDDWLLVKDALAHAPVELRFVRDGEELMDYLYCRGDYQDTVSSPRPDLILLDLNMPRKDGRTSLAEIKADPNLKNIPVVVLTTSHEEADVRCCYGAGANSFIVKPLSFERLTSTLKSLESYWFGAVRLPPKDAPKSCEELDRHGEGKRERIELSR